MIDLFVDASYLEIGVQVGKTFTALDAGRKVGVDPVFLFDTQTYAAQHPHCSFHATTSDAYFAQLSPDERFDVIYIDGLHTFEQTLRDLMNAVSFVLPDSIIVVDDVAPPNVHAANPNQEEATRSRLAAGIAKKAWMGDVYRLVAFVDTFMPRWSFACTAENHGQMVMWQAPRRTVAERRVEDIGAMSYDAYVEAKPTFEFLSLDEIAARIERSRRQKQRREGGSRGSPRDQTLPA